MNEEIVKALARAGELPLSEERAKQIAPLLAEQLQALRQLRPLDIVEEPVSLFQPWRSL